MSNKLVEMDVPEDVQNIVKKGLMAIYQRRQEEEKQQEAWKRANRAAWDKLKAEHIKLLPVELWKFVFDKKEASYYEAYRPPVDGSVDWTIIIPGLAPIDAVFVTMVWWEDGERKAGGWSFAGYVVADSILGNWVFRGNPRRTHDISEILGLARTRYVEYVDKAKQNIIQVDDRSEPQYHDLVNGEPIPEELVNLVRRIVREEISRSK